MVDRTVTTRLEANVSGFVRGMAEAKASLAALNREINTSNDRTSWLAGSILALAPAAVPIGAAVVPAVAALTTELGLAAAAGGVMALAFVGVGDALKALDDYQLDPTTAHLKKLNQEMKKLGPDGREFVKFLDELEPKLNALRMTARAELFPGVEEGLTAFEARLPDLKRIIGEIANTLGNLSAEGGKKLAGPEFDAFFEFLKTDAAPILKDLGEAFGNVILGIANMTVAFAPTSKDFTKGMLDMARSFEQWSETLASSQSFQDFIAYVRENTPAVLDFIGQLVTTFIDLGEAAAPIGHVMLPVLTSMLEILGAIAKTPVGSLIITLTSVAALYGRLIAIKNLASGGIIGSLITGQMGKLGEEAEGANRRLALVRGSAFAAGLALTTLSSTISDHTNPAVARMTDTLGEAAIGFSVGGPWGAAIFAGIGLLTSFGKANEDQVGKVRSLTEELRAQEGQIRRTAVVQMLADQGVFKAGSKIGADPTTITNAALGDPAARGVVKNLAPKNGTISALGLPAASLVDSEARAWYKVTDAINGTNTARREAIRNYAAERQALGLLPISKVNQIAKATKGIPRSVITKFSTPGAPQGFRITTELQTLYKKHPKQLLTALRMTGLTPAQIKAIADALKQVKPPKKVDISVKGPPKPPKLDFVVPKATTAKQQQMKTFFDVFAKGPRQQPKLTISDQANRPLQDAIDKHNYLNGLRTESTHTTHYETTGTPPAGGFTGGIVGDLLGGFASGGKVPGNPPSNPRRDNVTAKDEHGRILRVRSGEWIINERASRRHDRLLSAINSGARIPGFAGGRSGGSDGGMMLAELVNPTVRVQDDGLVKLIDTRVRVGVSGNSFHQRSRSRAVGG